MLTILTETIRGQGTIIGELETETATKSGGGADVRIQQSSYLLELSLDWIVVRASENIHHLLHESHVTLIEEALGKFVHAQALHDLRNLFSRLSGTTGIGRAYGIRFTDDHGLVDVAFHLADGHVLLEAVPFGGSFGENFGTVGGLISGLSELSGQALLDGGARRMRALTGYDRVRLINAETLATSSRGALASAPSLADFPIMISDASGDAVQLFPRQPEDTSAHEALLRAPNRKEREELVSAGILAILRLPFAAGGQTFEFWCESRTTRKPSFELHAAAELFAQMFAMQLALDWATNH